MRSILHVVVVGLIACAAAALLVPATPIVRAADPQVLLGKPDTGHQPSTKPSGSRGGGDTQVGWLELSGALRDGPPPFELPGVESTKPSLRTVVQQLRFIAKDKNHPGVIIYLDSPELTSAQVYELAAAIKEVQAAGKKVLFFAEAYDMRSYLLACAGDKILLQKKGELELPGIRVEEMYFAGTFEKIGMKADFLQIGAYKGAEEPFVRKGPSKEWSENFDHLLDDMYDLVLTRIGESRHMDKAAVEKVLADSWSMSDTDYVKRGLIDQLVDRNLIDATNDLFGENFAWDDEMGQKTAASVNLDNPFAVLRMLMAENKPQIKRQSIALVHCYGPIGGGESSASAEGPVAGLLGGGEKIGSRTISRIMGECKDNPLIKGVVLRIDSPGGSALASEVMWQAIRECGAEKPVFISVGGMAASGGYYLACAGHEIYVDPTSIVGSIGVVSGKFVMKGLYDWAGVNVYPRSRGPMGDMFSTVEPFSPEEHKILEASMRKVYDQFNDRVKTGRGKRIKDLESVNQGRLFTGHQAVSNGLADKIGGVEAALTDLAKQLKLEPGTFDIVDMPEPMTLAEYLSKMFGGEFVSAPGSAGGLAQQTAIIKAIQETLGRDGWRQARTVMQGYMQLRTDHHLLLTPSAVVVK